MSGTSARYFRGQPCCDGRAPVWGYLTEMGMGAIGGPLGDDEQVAIAAVANYGGTFRAGHPSQLMPMEHTNLVDWNRPIFMSAANSWGPPFNRDLPRLNCFADLPSLPNPDVGPVTVYPCWICATWNAVTGTVCRVSRLLMFQRSSLTPPT